MPLFALIGSLTAAHDQSQAAKNAAQLQQEMFQQMEQNLSPFYSAGPAAMNNLMALLGVGGGGTGGGAGAGGELTYNLPQGFNIPPGDALAIGAGGKAGYIDPKTGKITNLPGVANFGAPGAGGTPAGGGGQNGILAALQNTPGYQFTKQQGEQSLINQRSAIGGVGGGNTQEALMTFGSGLADQTYEQAVGNAYNLAALSENAAAGAGSLAQGFGSNIAQALMAQGTAQASGAVGATNALSSGMNNFLLAALQAGGGF